MDQGPESIQDAIELEKVRAQARRVHIGAAAAAMVATLAALLLP